MSLSTRVRIWSSRCAPRGLQRICCFLTMRLLMTWLTADSANELKMISPASRVPGLRDGRGVDGEVAGELADRLGEFVLPVRVLRAAGVLVFEVGGDVVDGLQRAKDVAVPQKPFQPLQLGGEGGRQLGWDAQAFGQLHHHGDPHREVEPVQQCSACGLR